MREQQNTHKPQSEVKKPQSMISVEVTYPKNS